MSLRKYISTIIDKAGVVWVYEGMVEDFPMWVDERDAKPKLMTEINAHKVADWWVSEDETIMIKKVK